MHHGHLPQSPRFEDAGDAATARMGFSSQVLMTEHPPMEITVRESGTIPVLEVRGRLTIGEPSEQLNDALEAVTKAGAHKVVVDLNGVPQIDSSGISALVRISIKLTREGGGLRLVCGPGRVRDALTVTRLVEAIPTFDSESAALANFA
jgi:anti-anti-sigma factor